MDDRNKDLPLIVSEILIEMHEMKETLNRVAVVVTKQQEHMNIMFNVLLDENKKNMEFMISMLADVRQENKSLIQEMRQETAELIEKGQQEAQQDREFMTYSLNKTTGQQQQANAAFEQRLLVLEAKYNG